MTEDKFARILALAALTLNQEEKEVLVKEIIAGGGGGAYVLKSGDTMTGTLNVTTDTLPVVSGTPNLGSPLKKFGNAFIQSYVQTDKIQDDLGTLNISPKGDGSQILYKSWDPIMLAISVARAKLGYYEILYAGDINHGNVSDAVGPILKDRTTATKYRVYVDSGALLLEAV